MRFASPRRSGFSLVELMIAIMILGLGMVMVATVFPVSLDLTRSTLQLNISEAGFESAVAALKIRLPSSYPGLEPYPVNTTTSVVLFPNVPQIELWNSTTDIDGAEWPARYPDVAAALMVPAKMAFPELAFAWPSGTYATPHDTIAAYWNGLSTAKQTDFVTYSKPYTELSLWDPEIHQAFRGRAWVIPSQNLRAADGELIPETKISSSETYSLPYIQNVDSISGDWATYKTPQPPAIHLADRVYPPISIEYDSTTGFYFDRASKTVFDDSAPENDRYVKLANFTERVAREKRYSWTAFARQGGNTLEEFKNGRRSFLCTIVLTYRGDLNARYARQDQPVDGANFSQFNFNNSGSDRVNDENLMRFPRADTTYGAGTDTVFPQPWLVMLDVVNPSAGVVTCRGAVAKLLPSTSYFIVAQTDNSNVQLQAGLPIKVKKGVENQVLKADVQYTLEIDRSGGNTISNLPVWVFPPAINSDRASFQGTSPVAGTAIREITPDWGK